MTATFGREALTSLATAYPEQPCGLRHTITDHPLLGLDALAALSQRMRPVDVEYNRADLPIGVDPRDVPNNGLSAIETIKEIEKCGSWMVLKFVEQDPSYRDLLRSILSDVEPAIGRSTGPMLKPEAFIFLSSPGAITPFHFDPEHNILLQIRGSKTMTLFLCHSTAIVASELHEAFHAGAHRNLPWNDEHEQQAVPFTLRPGDALYVPVKAPHWVRNGDMPSVSISVTWRSEWSYHEEYAHHMNRLLRRMGLRPAPPKRFPNRNWIKSTAYRALAKADRIARSRQP